MSLFTQDLLDAASALLEMCRQRRLRLATAESCTGGLAAGLLTSISGASDVFDRGFVTYSNEAKNEELGVPPSLIKDHGAVSEEVARAMAEGALAHSLADIAVSVTGVAGPTGGTATKPVGLVHIACARKGIPTLHRRLDLGNRNRDWIRLESVRAMLEIAARQAAAAP